MSDQSFDEYMRKSPAARAVDTASYLLKDTSEANMIDPRSESRRQFDAMFYIVKDILFQLERIGDQLEYSRQGYLDRDQA